MLVFDGNGIYLLELVPSCNLTLLILSSYFLILTLYIMSEIHVPLL